jgi:hypothetical protein
MVIGWCLALALAGLAATGTLSAAARRVAAVVLWERLECQYVGRSLLVTCGDARCSGEQKCRSAL